MILIFLNNSFKVLLRFHTHIQKYEYIYIYLPVNVNKDITIANNKFLT